MSDSQEDSVSVRDHLQALIRGEHERNNMRAHAEQEAVTQFRTTTEARFASMNEFRGTLTDQATTFATRDSFAGLDKEVTTRVDALSKDVIDLSVRLSKVEGRLFAYSSVVAGAFAIISVALLWLHKG